MFKCLIFAGFGGQGVCCPRVSCVTGYVTHRVTVQLQSLPVHLHYDTHHCHTPFAYCGPLFETGWVGNHCEHTPHSHCSTLRHYMMVWLEVDRHWRGLLPQGVWARYTLCHRWGLTSKHMHQLVVLTLHKTHHSTEDTQDSKRQGRFHLNIMEGKDTLHSSPSQMGGPLSAASAPLLTAGADPETSTTSTLPSLSVKLHLTTVLAGDRCCRAPSGDRFLWECPPGGKQGQELKQGGWENRKSKIDNSHGNGWGARACVGNVKFKQLTKGNPLAMYHVNYHLYLAKHHDNCTHAYMWLHT